MLKFVEYFTLIILLYNVIYVSNANSATINAANCSQSDVQAAIDSASDGDTVVVPAGNCTWSTAVTFSNKAITVQGAGIDQTVITDETSSVEEPFDISGVDGKPFRITEFTFDGTNSSTWGLINIKGTSKNFRIDHCKFTNLTARGITIFNKNDGDAAYGVIDHNIFIVPYDLSVQSVSVIGDGNSAWVRPLTLGTVNAVYVEDNTFNYSYKNDGALDAYNGARYVFRYNVVNGTLVGNHGFDSGNYRSPVSFEIYNNTFSTLYNLPRVMHFRGGTGVVFNNTISGSASIVITTANYRDYHKFEIWGACDGTSPYDVNDGITYDSGTHTGSDGIKVLTSSGKSWAPDQWVGYSVHNTTKDKSSVILSNTNDSITYALDNYEPPLSWNSGDSFIILRAYPCGDQVGRTIDAGGDGIQDLAPFYEWNNILNGADADISSASPHIKENRDFYNDTQKPGYTPYTYPHPFTTGSFDTIAPSPLLNLQLN